MVNDNVFGMLLRVGLGFQKPVKEKVHFVLYKNRVMTLEQLDYTFLNRDGLVEIKTTLSPATTLEAKSLETTLRQKSAAIFGHSNYKSVQDLIDQAKDLNEFLKYLKDKYG